MSKLINTFTLDTVMGESLPFKYSMKLQDVWYYCFWRSDWSFFGCLDCIYELFSSSFKVGFEL
jgi:hypothetical protein